VSLLLRTEGATTAGGHGGVAARRAVLRWAWRLFRREWRQQVVVLALLTVTVGAAIGFATAVYNLAPVPGNAEFGTANHALIFDNPDPDLVQPTLAAAEERFGAADLIGHRDVPVSGSVDAVDYRDQDPGGPYGSPLLDLRDGRYPTTDAEVAITDGIADTFDADIGATFALDGVQRTVVGVVENPSDLDDEFVLQPPSSLASPSSVSLFVDAPDAQVESFAGALPTDTAGATMGSDHITISGRQDLPEEVAAAVIVLTVAAVALFLVSLVAAASFVVVAQRRLRQLGMLAAAGGTEKQVRLVLVANGAAAGAVAALLGTVVGVAGWIALVPRIEEAAGYRVDALNVPWWLLVTGGLLAVLTAAGAAWWPARTMARIPPVLALSGRPPRPAPAHRSATLAGAFIVGGLACLTLAGDVNETTGDASLNVGNLLLVAGGTLATIVGVLLVSPLAIRLLARGAARVPVAMRLALRDLGRYQARSGAALAAISLALGIPVAIVVVAAAAQDTADTGNLSDRQLMVQPAQEEHGPPLLPEPADLENMQAGLDRLVASLDEANLIPVDVAVDPDRPTEPGVDPRRVPVEVAEPTSDGWRGGSLLYVATPELVAYHGVDLDTLDPSTEFLTDETVELGIIRPDLDPGPGLSESETLPNLERLPASYSSLPGSFVTQEALLRRGWETAASGQWLVETSEPLTSDQLAAARDIAAGAGLTIESRDQQTGLSTLRSGATAVGMLLALGILAMTVGLIRSEAAGDLRTLTATGASSTTRRTLTAATAGGLALLGVVLGTIGAYAVLVAGFGDLADLSTVPVTNLAVIAVVTPLAAAATGWLLAGRQPAAITRQPIE
jgi:putative ABC transport system permease protein